MRTTILIAACFALSSCKGILDTNTEHLHFAGVVSSATTGQPIAGAEVSLEQSLFVFQGSVKADTTDQNGKYDIVYEARCQEETNLYSSAGNAYMLVARAAGFQQQSNTNNSVNIYCRGAVQTLNFRLSTSVISATAPRIQP